MEYKKLFSPFDIGGVTVKNRIVMSPMMMGFGTFDGTPTDALIDYYEERAKGGTGLIVTEITRINDKTGAAAFNQLAVSHDYHIEPLKKLANRIHAHGAKLFIQLHHPGRQNLGLMIKTVPLCIACNKISKNFGKLLFKAAPTAGKFLIDKKLTLSSVSASRTEPSYFSGGRVRALRRGEIKELINQFVEGAVRVQKSGCDGVTLHAAHGYLIQQFLSPNTNRREDEYGGSTENRARFVTEILSGIKQKCGKAFPVVVRLSVDECYSKIGLPDKGYKLDEGVKIAQILQKSGADAIDVSCAAYDTFNYWLEPGSFENGWRTDMIRAIKDAVKIPVIAVNIIRTPDEAEKQLVDGISDFVSLGRPHIADPYWAKKAESGGDIKRCISCLYCFESMEHNAYIGKPGQCAVNPMLGMEKLVLKNDGEGRRIAVVGAGAAGLTAAEILLKRGFKVRVYEKEQRVGGQAATAAEDYSKRRIGWCAEDLKKSVLALGGEILYEVKASPELLSDYAPYAVIIAAGGVPIVPKSIEGHSKPHVYTPPNILKKKVILKDENVAVIGSGMTGLDISAILGKQGNRVTVIEMAPSPAPNMWMQHLDDALPKLKAFGAKILTSKKLMEIKDKSIIIQDVKTKEMSELEATTVVLAMGVRPENSFADKLTDLCGGRVYTVGDAQKPGRIADATKTAFNAALNLV